MQTFILITHVFSAIAIIALVLVQHGKGADAGAAFGSGASGTVFGAKGSASFLTKLTAFIATIFFMLSIFLAYQSRVNTKTNDSSLVPGISKTKGTQNNNTTDGALKKDGIPDTAEIKNNNTSGVPDVTDNISKAAKTTKSNTVGVPEVTEKKPKK